MVGFATQVSIDPPRPGRPVHGQSHVGVARSATDLAVHVLGRDRMALIELFGGETGDDVDKFVRCTWSDGPAACRCSTTWPWMVGRIVERYDFGDHVGHLLEPVSGEVAAPSPDRVVTSATPTDWNLKTRLTRAINLFRGHV